ncbi:F0F1 ATP synthase subunit B [Haloplasma contractile]|uniref:ATP synthase subunit b n=1 Tax=Haloplasma contractile SSD-17B TaxID=1033810 RepID=U2DSG1_9MOLU|nr:F0F1 ATP synthase subunit B [Haloplasma contractile]ERJ11462.1 ATP synthase subunit b protein [Haloplasma contractile SSD-17B]
MDFAKAIEQLVNEGLFPNPVTFIIQITSTVILFIVLKRLVWDAVVDMLEKRQDVIVNDLKTARKSREEAVELQKSYESQLQNAKEQASEIVDRARKSATEQSDLIISEAEEKARYKIEKAENEIELERERVRSNLKNEVVEIALLAAEKLVNENMDNEKNRNLINQFIEEVGE